MAPQLQGFFWGGGLTYHFVTQIQVLRALLVTLMAGRKGGRQQARQLSNDSLGSSLKAPSNSLSNPAIYRQQSSSLRLSPLAGSPGLSLVKVFDVTCL